MSDEGKHDHGNLVLARGGYLAPVPSSNPLVSRGLADVVAAKHEERVGLLALAREIIQARSQGMDTAYHEEIYRLTFIDFLTGIHNKRALLEFVDSELARSALHHQPLSLVRFDIDRFKTLNIDLGHLARDFTLRELVSLGKEAIRKEEMFARYGGEEFVVVLPETNSEIALLMSERLRLLVEAHHFQYEERRFHITISLGLVTTDGDESLTPNDLIKQAEEKLSQAKRDGGNRVVA